MTQAWIALCVAAWVALVGMGGYTLASENPHRMLVLTVVLAAVAIVATVTLAMRQWVHGKVAHDHFAWGTWIGAHTDEGAELAERILPGVRHPENAGTSQPKASKRVPRRLRRVLDEHNLDPRDPYVTDILNNPVLTTSDKVVVLRNYAEGNRPS